MSAPRTRHDMPSIALHWVCAACAVGAVAVGAYMTRGGVDFASQFRLQQIHKSLGVMVFALAVVWLLWRLVATAPAGREAHRPTRLLLLALLLAVPLSGWVLVSAAVFKVPTFVFGALWIPHLPWFDTLSDPQPAARLTGAAHTALAAVFSVVMALHLVQSFRGGRDTLGKMLPPRGR